MCVWGEGRCRGERGPLLITECTPQVAQLSCLASASVICVAHALWLRGANLWPTTLKHWTEASSALCCCCCWWWSLLLLLLLLLALLLLALLLLLLLQGAKAAPLSAGGRQTAAQARASASSAGQQLPAGAELCVRLCVCSRGAGAHTGDGVLLRWSAGSLPLLRIGGVSCAAAHVYVFCQAVLTCR